MIAPAPTSRGADRQPSADPATTIWVEVRFDWAKSPLPFSWPMIAIAATLRPCASAVIILITGSENVTAEATSVPAILLTKSPSMSGMSDCTTPSMRLGMDRNMTLRQIEPFRMSSLRSCVD